MTTVWAGLATGAIYSFVAIGYNIVMLASGVFNFAQAQLVMLGTFMAYVGLSVMGLPVVVAALFAAMIVAGVAIVEERIAVRPLIARGDGGGTLIATIGAGTVIAGVVSRTWGTDPLVVPTSLSSEPLHLLGGTIQLNDLLLIVLVLAVGFGLHWWSRSSRYGLASLASAENRRAAMLRGINIRALGVAAFALTGLIAGAAGVLIGPRTYAVSTLGDQLALFGFVAIALGGAGSQLGGLLGGFVIGLIDAFAGRYLGSGYPQIAIFVVLLLILLVRPQGLFGRPMERVV